MKTKRINFLITILFAWTFHVNAQIKIDYEYYFQLLSENKCEDLVSETYKIRSSEEYGKNWVIDYFMAMGFCCSGNKALAYKGFNYISDSYPDNTKIAELLTISRSGCSLEPRVANRLEMAKLLVSNWQGGTEPSLVSGKFGYVLNCNQDIESYQFNPDFDQSELQKRLFLINEADSAQKYYKSFLSAEKYNINASGRFIYVTLKNDNLDNNRIQKITDELERAYQFMVNYYSVRPPDKLIAVYLMGNKKRLAEAAMDTHGLQIPSQNYGYSCLADLSILGNSSSTGLGTILHELFHLIVRTDVGDIPGWLDEGIACLYEESHWENGKLVSNERVWRTSVLKLSNKTKNPLPILRTLIQRNWTEFMPNPATTICDLAINYAMAKHFAMYLEEKELLPTVVNAYKNRENIFVDSTYTNESSVSILENALSKDLSAIQLEFDLWLKDNYGITTKRETSDLRRRIDDLYFGLKIYCEDDPDMPELREEYEFLDNNLSGESSDVPNELFDRSTRFISKAESLIVKYKDH